MTTQLGIREKIESLRPFYAWLLFIFLYVSFSTEVLWRPFIFCEDTIFLNNALTDGIKSVFYRHAGYLEIISRLTANIAIFLGKGANSYLVTAFVMKAVAISLYCYYILYFGIADFSWLVKEKWQRYLISFIVLAWFGNFFDSYYNITNMHWAGEFFIFLVGLNLVCNKKFPGKFCIIICLLTCLQSPEACLLVIPVSIYVLNGIIKRKIKLIEILAYLLVFVAVCLQFWVLKISGGNSLNGNGIYLAVPKSLISILSTASYVLGNEIISYVSTSLRLMIGSLIWIFIVFSYKKLYGTKGMLFIVYALIFLFLHYMMIHIKPLNALFTHQDFWIYSCPAAILALSFFSVAMSANSLVSSNTLKHFILLFSTIVVISQVSHAGKIGGLESLHYKSYDYDMLGMGRLEEANKSVDFKSNKYKSVKLYDQDWAVLMPTR